MAHIITLNDSELNLLGQALSANQTLLQNLVTSIQTQLQPPAPTPTEAPAPTVIEV